MLYFIWVISKNSVPIDFYIKVQRTSKKKTELVQTIYKFEKLYYELILSVLAC